MLTPLRITHATRKRSEASIKEAAEFIESHPTSPLLTSYRVHAEAMETILQEVEIVDELPAGEAAEAASAFHERLKTIKAEIRAKH